MRQQKYTQTQQVIDTLRTTGGYATLGDLYHLVDTKSWATKTPNESIYQSEKRDFVLAHGDCFKLLKEFDFKFDMIFADPPYFLSNGGISLQSGKVVCVNKGNWDKGKSQEDMMAFNMEWLRLCRDKLKDNSFNMFRCKE
jgi:16S rRNA G966 N2-methylase RsmD